MRLHDKIRIINSGVLYHGFSLSYHKVYEKIKVLSFITFLVTLFISIGDYDIVARHSPFY